MTLRTELKKELERNYKFASKKYINQNGLELTWNPKENLYSGKDERGVEWIAALQRTIVPIFSIICPNKLKINEREIICCSPNFVPITIENNKTITCRQCKIKFIPKLNINPTSAAFEMFQNLDK